MATNPNIIPIGAVNSVENTTVYILDPETLQQLKMDEVGAIYIGGKGMAIGYKNKPELTKEKFVADEFTKDLGGLMYW